MRKTGLFLAVFCLMGLLLLPAPAQAEEQEEQKVVFSISESGMIILRVHFPYFSDNKGNLFTVKEGDWVAMHSRFLNHKNGDCNDTLAVVQIDPCGWAQFTFENPLVKFKAFSGEYPEFFWPEFFWGRHWFHRCDQCKTHPDLLWGYIRKKEEGNAHYRLDCEGQPGIEALYYRYSVSVVPEDWPCDPWEPVCE